MARKTAKAKKVQRRFTTEEKIKNAALKLFTRKGYVATRTRDISEEAGINLALLNYYFRSKEKLFELVMMETLQNFFRNIGEILNDPRSSLEEKVQLFVVRYTDLLKEQPDLPLFIFHEIRQHPGKLAARMHAREVFFDSFFFKQLREKESTHTSQVNPLHYFINMISMCVFPFIGAPLLKHVVGIDAKQFERLVDERKSLVPRWMKQMYMED
jgi:AcrR family transcriptional regulator